jgi:L,D-transpeptidase YcbB
MKKIISMGVVIIVGSTLMAEASFAQENERPRRKGFFESLFGVKQKPRKPVFNSRAWWEDDPSDVRIIRPPQQNKKNAAAKAKTAGSIITADIDPEAGEGLGMGNINYSLPKLAPVYDPALRNITTTDTEATAIRAVLTDKSTDLRATQDIRAAVLEHYKSTGFKPIWTKQGSIDKRALATLVHLSQAGEEGLEPRRYLPALLESFTPSETQFQGDLLGAAHFDVGMTLAAVTYAVHQSGGAFEPERLSAYHDLKPEAVSPKIALRVLAHSPFPGEYLKTLAPAHPAYALMKSELAAMPSIETPLIMAEGKRVRIGQKDPRIAQLRELLLAQGFLGAAAAEVELDKEDVLDKTLAKALKAYQTLKGLPQTSNLDTATVRAINGPDLGARREMLLTNMERLRWLPKQLGNRHVFVNQASYLVDVFDQNKLIWESNVIVGKPLTQTNVFSDTMETVVLNPSWGMPQSILLGEYLPKLRANPGYLDKIGFKVVNASGKVVPSRSINWNSVGSGSGIGVQQPPGESNALGKVKFLFPNKHSIYMHDTPNRHLFAESKRNFSHGCVRVENPVEFASVLLNLDQTTVNDDIESGKSKSVKISTPTRVHLTYFTVWPDKSGKLQFYSDAYGRDKTLREARVTAAKVLGLKADQQLSQKAQ